MGRIVDPRGLLEAQKLYGELPVDGKPWQCLRCGGVFRSLEVFDAHDVQGHCDLRGLYLNGLGYIVRDCRELH